MNEYQNKVTSCIRLVKEQVKAKPLNYQTIADRLNISLLTVKRQLNSEDISMSKLLAICDAAEINFSEIWQTVDETEATHTIISDEQDNAFYKNPHLFSFFMELFQQKRTPEEIKQQWGLTPASLHLYLRKLETLDLIRVSAQQKISFRVSEPLGFGSESKVIHKEVANQLKRISELYGSDEEQSELMIAKPLTLSVELREKMYQELCEIISRYAQLSEKYFIQSALPVFNLAICSYLAGDAENTADIINVSHFK
ncbi:hypothetical protein [Thalassotalea ganghwensis]